MTQDDKGKYYIPPPRLPEETGGKSKELKLLFLGGGFVLIFPLLNLDLSNQGTVFADILSIAMGIGAIVYALFYMGANTLLIDSSTIVKKHKGRVVESFPMSDFVLLISPFQPNKGGKHYSYDLSFAHIDKPDRSIFLINRFQSPENLREYVVALQGQVDKHLELNFKNQSVQYDYEAVL